MNSVEQLNAMKNKIEKAKQDDAKLQGQSEELMKTLEGFGCSSIEEAEKLLEETQADLEAKQREFDEGVKELTERCNW